MRVMNPIPMQKPKKNPLHKGDKSDSDAKTKEKPAS
jgi:hypothetical protein